VDATGSRNQLVLPESCDSVAVAYDGIWRSFVPDTLNAQAYSLPGGGRLDIALKCNVEGVYNVTYAGKFVASLNVTAGVISTATPYAGGTNKWKPFRPAYLVDMRSFANSTFTVTIGENSVNGKSYDLSDPLRDVTYGSVEEWTLKLSQAFPIRTSTYPMQVVSCPGYSTGEFYDTIAATDTNDCIVRLRVLDFSGKFVAQSSDLRYAQQGAKAWFKVSSGGVAASTDDINQKTCS
jgi:hypothetical protein